ncbi:hypothetical protein, partial [Escherichia coli]
FLNSNENFSMHPQFLVWCLTFGAQFMAEWTNVTVVGNNITSGSSSSSYYLSPAEVSSLCEQISK